MALISISFVPKFLAFLLLNIQINNVSSVNILVWQAVGTHSTRIAMWPLMEALSEKGHNITFVSVFENMDKSNSSIKSIIPKKWKKEVGKSWEEHFNFFELRRKPWNIPKLYYDFLDLSVKACEALYSDQDFLQWATSEVTKFDLVIVESWMHNDCAYGLIHHWNARLIIYGTTTVLPFMPDAFGIPDETSSIGDVIFNFPFTHENPLSFWQRFLNALNPIVYSLRREWYYFPVLEEITRKGLGLKENELPKFKDIEKNTSLVLLTTHFSFGAARSFPPNVVPILGAVVAPKSKSLPQDIKDFVDSANNGFIYISFGTVTEFANFEEDVQKEFIAALRDFPDMRFVWKSAKTINHKLPENVLVTKWAPQQTLLAHPKIKAFISHVGISSTIEAIHFKVPLICIPVLAEQDMDAEIIEQRSAGLRLEVLTLKKEELTWAIKEILENQKFRQGMERLSKIFKDRPRPPLEEAVWWIEYVLRHDNIKEFLTPPSVHQPWWKRRQFDIWITTALLIILIFSLLIYLIQLIVKRAFRMIFLNRSNSKILKTLKSH